MPTEAVSVKKGDLWLGIALLGAAVIVLVFTQSIHSIGLGDNFDPGPRAFPIGLSAMLAIGGLIELWKSRAKPETASGSPPMGSPSTEASSDSNHKTVLLLLGCFLVYVLLLPWLGFSISTLLMATLMMLLLGNTWKQSLLVSIILITIIYVLFVLLFKVPLPSGVLGLPF